MNRIAFISQAIVTANNLLLSLAAIILLEGNTFKVWFIVSQTYFITLTFLRSAFFEPANFQNRQVKITLRDSVSLFAFISLFNFLVIGFSIEFNSKDAFLVSMAACFSLFQDHLRYKHISSIPQKVALADGLVFVSTSLLIIFTKIDNVVLFTGLYIALPNLISIIYLNKSHDTRVFEQESFRLNLMSIYSLSATSELALNQIFTVMSALFLTNLELQNMRGMMLIAAPLTSLRLFSWTGLIVRAPEERPTSGKNVAKFRVNSFHTALLPILLFVLSDSKVFSFIPIYSRISLALVLTTTWISLVFVERAASIRKMGNYLHLLYFAASIPLTSITYLGIQGSKSNINDLIIVQFSVTLLNSILSLLFLRRERI